MDYNAEKPYRNPSERHYRDFRRENHQRKERAKERTEEKAKHQRFERTAPLHKIVAEALEDFYEPTLDEIMRTDIALGRVQPVYSAKPTHTVTHSPFYAGVIAPTDSDDHVGELSPTVLALELAAELGVRNDFQLFNLYSLSLGEEVQDVSLYNGKIIAEPDNGRRSTAYKPGQQVPTGYESSHLVEHAIEAENRRQSFD